LLLDPASGRAGVAATRVKDRKLQVYLQLASGESAIVRTYRTANSQPAAPRWQYLVPINEGVALPGEWQLTFMEGGPVLPAPARMKSLASWASLADPQTQQFAGTVRYRIEFDAPAAKADEWLLDLGDVREVARVRLNGTSLGSAWSVPFRLRLAAPFRPRGNVLEVEVTNLAANRIRDLDVRKVPWKNMRDANLVSVKYRPFDASGWAIEPSGLLGPVRLVPAGFVSPD
jgi:hypothetical protein